MTSEGAENFPPPPEKPLDSDCCGSGCNPCILDVYDKNFARWKKNCQNNFLETLPISSALLSELRYSPFKLTNVEMQSQTANVYTFQAVEQKDGECREVFGDLGIRMGQHLMLKAMSEDGTKFSRAYTPITQSSGQFQIIVKLYEAGQMSKYFSQMKLGDVEHFRGPYGDFRYTANRYSKVVMVCAGTGIAAVIGIARDIVEVESDETVVAMFYSVRNVAEILLRDELTALGGYWNFQARIHVTRGGVEGKRYLEHVNEGRITESVLRNEIGANVLVLICGTEQFSREMMTFVKNVEDCDSFVF